MGAPAKFKGNTSEDQADKHKDDRHIESRKYDGVGKRKDRHQAAPAEYKPGLIAIPDWGYGIDQHIAVAAAGEEGKYDPNAKVESIENHIGEDGESDDTCPDEGEINVQLSLRATRLARDLARSLRFE